MKKGLVTIPTDKDYVEGTKKYIKLWGADAIRDCDGVSLPDDLKQFGTEVYKAYFIVREDHEYAKNHPDELQDVALITPRHVAKSTYLDMDLLEDIFEESIAVNPFEYQKYWQVFDRTTGEEHHDFTYLGNNIVRINQTVPYHEYTVSFFGRSIWDPVQIYNYTVNNWDVPKDQDLNPACENALNHMLYRFEKWLKENPEVTVVRFTSFFYNFFILYQTARYARIWDWHIYACTASPAMFELFKKERGYEIKLEDVVTEGYYANRFMVPTKRTRDYIDFVQKKSCEWAKLFVDLAHKYGKKAMFFDGDHRVGTEPYNPYFPSIGLDAVVGAPSSSVSIQVIANMPGVKYTEGRLAPYFFPNECPNDTDGTNLLTHYWHSERRGLLRKSIDRIGFGGYLKQVDAYPNFVKKVTSVCDEFRTIRANSGVKGCKTKAKIALISFWGKMDSWMYNGRCVDDFKQEGVGYAAMLNALSGQPFEVDFISFDDVISQDLSKYDCLISNGLPQTSFQGGEVWKNPQLVTKMRAYVASGGGFIGIGEPSGFPFQGKFIQLSDVLGVEKDINLRHFENRPPLEEEKVVPWFIDGLNLDRIVLPNYVRGMFKTTATVLKCHFDERFPADYPNAGHVDLAFNFYEKGRSIYCSSLQDNFETYRFILKAILWCAQKEELLLKCFSENIYTDAYYYEDKQTYAILNSASEEVTTTFYDLNGKPTSVTLAPHEIKWIK